jgi:hypothetical protein
MHMREESQMNKQRSSVIYVVNLYLLEKQS